MPKAFALWTALMILSPLPAWPADQMPWLPNIISDHMVLQAGHGIPLWGKDLPGTRVVARLNGATASGSAGADGRWSLQLPALKAGGPYDLVIAGSVTRTVSDVLIGEVWLGSGQSNMELAMRVTKDQATEVPAATDAQMRFFTADRCAAFAPKDDVTGSWQVCSPESVKAFSAVAYHFGKALRAQVKAPLGLIVASWGGTPGEDWVPRPALDQEASLAPLMKEWDADQARHELWASGEDFDLKVSGLHFQGAGKDSQPLAVAFGQAAPGQLGGAWSHSEKPDSSGSYEAGAEDSSPLGRYHGKVRGGGWASASVALKPGGSVDLSGQESIHLKVKGQGHFILTLGQASITDYDYYASQPFELSGDWQDLSIPLASLKQGGWGSARAFTPQAVSNINFSVQVPYWPDLGAVAYNGMIAPLIRTPIQGVLWYQGESNAGRAGQYPTVLGALMKSWRQAWGQDTLPFFVVQLPNYADAFHWGALRDAQRLACAADPHCSLTTTLGLGEKHDVHPKDKKPVGERLAAAAMGLVYGQKSGPLSPSLKGASLGKDGQVSLLFEHAENGLETKGDDASGGIELAGSDGVFKAAKIKIMGSQILAWNADITAPKSVRHAWADDPASYLSAIKGQAVPSFQQSLP